MPPEQVTLEWFARSYHFSEDQTRYELSPEALDWWPIIALARMQAQQLEQARAERMQAGSRR